MVAAGAVDPLQQGVGGGGAGVGQGVGQQDDAVGGAGPAALDGGVVAAGDTGLHVGGVGGAQPVDDLVHALAVVVQAGHREPGLGLVAEGDDGDRVVAAEPVGHQVQGLPHQVEAAGFGHRTGDVDDEGEGGGRAAVLAGAGPRGESDAHQGPVRGVGAGAVDGHGEAVAVGLPVVLAEAVDELFRADGRGVGQLAVGEGPAGVAPARGVDVEGEGGEVVRGRCRGAAAVVLALRRSVGPVGGAGRALGGARDGVAALGPPAALLGGAAAAVVAAVGGAAPGEQHRPGGEHGEHGRSLRAAVAATVAVAVAGGRAQRHGVPLRTFGVCECDVREGELEPTRVLRTRLERATAGGTSRSGRDQDTMTSRRATPAERRTAPRAGAEERGETGLRGGRSRGGIGRAAHLRPGRRGTVSWTARQHWTACCRRRTRSG